MCSIKHVITVSIMSLFEVNNYFVFDFLMCFPVSLIFSKSSMIIESFPFFNLRLSSLLIQGRSLFLLTYFVGTNSCIVAKMYCLNRVQFSSTVHAEGLLSVNSFSNLCSFSFHFFKISFMERRILCFTLVFNSSIEPKGDRFVI